MNREQYLLTCLSEECVEVAHRASKAIRFGLDEKQETQDKDNRERLAEEVADLIGVLIMLDTEAGGGIFPTENPVPRKAERVEKYYAYSKELGLAV